MTLIAHYRLDGNADDAFGKFNGVASDVTWVAGKLGQAASFNGSTSYIDSKISPEIFRADVSICMWANFLDDSRGILFGNYNNVGGFAVEKHTSNRLRVYFNGSFDYFTPNNVITTAAWHHLAFVRDTRANQWRVYVDGSLVGSTAWVGAWVMAGMSTVWIGRDIRTGTTTTYGSLDDVRIYDHALSLREVRDLAMGLAVHYPMMDFQEPTENLYPMPAVGGNYFTDAFDGQYGYGINTNAQWVVDNSDQPVAGLPVQKVSRIESGVSQFLYLQWENMFPAKSLAPGQSVTISFWYYGTYGTSIMPYIGGGTGGVVFAGSGGDSQVIAVPVRQWHRVSFTLTNPTSETKTYGYGWMRLHYNTEIVALSNQEFWKFTAVQTELKSYPTEYTQGVRSARVVDTSGQGADAPLALTTTPKWIEESPTGRGSYLFTNDATKRIDRPLVDLGSTLTYSCWAKQVSTEGHDRKFIVSSGRDVITHGVNVLSQSGDIRVIYGGGPQGGGTLSSGVSVVGVWRHIVFTHDMVNGARLYVDGVLTATGPARTIDYSEANNRTVIGKMAYGYTGTANYFPFSGPISDVRFYASALTAEQVKELYQQRASLDAQGNFYARHLQQSPRARYIRDHINGSTANNSNHWTEIQAFDFSGRNVALNALAYDAYGNLRPRLTNNVITLNEWYGAGGLTNSPYMEIDLGKVFELDKVCVWHYYGDVRSYYGAKTEISEDGINWTTIFDSAIDGTYQESPEGHTVKVSAPNRVGLNARGQFTSGNFSEVGITDGLVAYYPLNKNAQDYSGNEYDGVVNGAVSVAGGFDGKGAFGFDGVDDYINLDVSHAAQVEITMSLWMAVGTASLNAGVLTQRRAGFHSRGIITAGNEIRAFSRNSAGTWQQVVATVPFVPGQYHHAVLVQTGSVISLFVDGTLRQTLDMGSFATEYGGFFRVGNYTDANLPYQGNICNIKIFNRALTAQEIAVEYKRTGPTKMTQHQGVTYIQGEIKEV